MNTCRKQAYFTHKGGKEEVVNRFVVTVDKQGNERDESEHCDHHNEHIAGQKTKREKQQHCSHITTDRWVHL